MRLIVICITLLSTFLVNAQDQWKITSDSLIEIAKGQLGVGYKYATSNPGKSFDCSGFVSYVYDSLDLPNSRSSKEYQHLGKKVSLEECRKGDCILFTGTDSKKRVVGHVGIIVSASEDELIFIHCSSSKKHFGVVLTEYYSSGYPARYMEVRRMIE